MRSKYWLQFIHLLLNQLNFKVALYIRSTWQQKRICILGQKKDDDLTIP